MSFLYLSDLTKQNVFDLQFVHDVRSTMAQGIEDFHFLEIALHKYLPFLNTRQFLIVDELSSQVQRF